MIKTGYKTVGSRNLTGGMSDALSNVYTMLNASENEKLERERLAKQEQRQAIVDAQNKQLFDMKIAESNRVAKARADEEAYLKGITQPDAYGLKAGTDQIVQRLGEYGENPRAKAALAAGPGSKEYEQYFKEMEELGNTITGQSMDDRTIGYATANPDNVYAAGEAMKAEIARKGALDAEAKSLADKKFQYVLKGAELEAKGQKSGSTSTGKTAAGYAVKDPGIVAKSSIDLLMKANDLDKVPSGMLDHATRLANEGYDAAQTAQILSTGFTPGKSGFIFDDKAKFTPNTAERLKIGVPRNRPVMQSSSGTDMSKYNALAKTFDDRLKQVQDQRDGRVGLSALDQIIGNVPKTSVGQATESGKKAVKEAINKIVESDPEVTNDNEAVIKKAVEAIITKPAPTKEGIEAIEKAAIAKKDAELQKRAQSLKASLKTGGLSPMSDSNKAQWKYLLNAFTAPVKSAYDTYQENIGRPFADLVNEYAPGGRR
jgi:hypothetical protein